MSEHVEVVPDDVHLDFEGHCTRRWFVRLPRGSVADDLKDPKIWSKVQRTRPKALRRHDAIYAVGYAEEFAVEARVTDVTAATATLALQKIISFPERTVPLFHDDNYRVVWAGSGYAVERRADGMHIGGIFGSEQLAICHIQRQYPVPV